MGCDTKDLLEVFDKIGGKSLHRTALLSEVKREFNVTDADAANALIDALQNQLLTIDRSGFLDKYALRAASSTSIDGVLARQMTSTLGKVWCGRRPGDKHWTPADDSALDLALADIPEPRDALLDKSRGGSSKTAGRSKTAETKTDCRIAATIGGSH